MKGIVDISFKHPIQRLATAEGRIVLQSGTLEAIRTGEVKKGDVQEIGRVAAINAVKKTPELILHCHQIPIESIEVAWEMLENGMRVAVTVKATAKTGVEMEALVGVTTALLTVWDMVKYLEKDEQGQYPEARIEGIKVTKKIKKISND